MDGGGDGVFRGVDQLHNHLTRLPVQRLSHADERLGDFVIMDQLVIQVAFDSPREHFDPDVIPRVGFDPTRLFG